MPELKKISVIEGWLIMLIGLVKNEDVVNAKTFLQDKICELNEEKCTRCLYEECPSRSEDK
jgi:hypothetical protein